MASLLLPEIFTNILSFTATDNSQYKQSRSGALRFALVSSKWQEMAYSSISQLKLLVGPEMDKVLSQLTRLSHLELIISTNTTVEHVFNAFVHLLPGIRQLTLTLSHSLWEDQSLNLIMNWIQFHPSVFDDIQLNISDCPFLKRPNCNKKITHIKIKSCQRLREIEKIDTTDQLKSCEISECGSFTDSSVERLFAQYPNIQTAVFRSCGQLKRPKIQSKQLQSIEFQLCKQLTDAAIENMVQQCPTLHTLAISQCPKLNPSLASFSLETVSFTSCQRLTWSMVQTLCRQCPKLNALSLHNAPNTKTVAPPVLMSNSIQRLVLNTCHGVTDEMLSKTTAQCPQLQHVELLHLPKLSHPYIACALKRVRVESCGNFEALELMQD